MDTQDTSGVVRGAIERFPPSLYLRETALTRLDPAIAEFAEAIAARRRRALRIVHALLERLHNEMVVSTRRSDPVRTTTAAEAFALKRGVCQDFTHIFIAAARSLPIPARYIGGHFFRSDGVTVQEAAHAWAEAFVPISAGSPSTPRTAYARPTRMCASRSASIISARRPMRGSRYGGGDEALDVAVAGRSQRSRATSAKLEPSAAQSLAMHAREFRDQRIAWMSGEAIRIGFARLVRPAPQP